MSKCLCVGAYAACLLLILGAAGGCKTKGSDADIMTVDEFDSEGGAGAGTATDELPNIDADRLESLIFNRATGLQTVYFDYDSSSLRPDARDTLRANADKINQAPGVLIQIEGHCDERGTQAYNFALGERRALAVRKYLMNLGVSSDRLVTISYGEENPAVPGSGESAFAKNRRCEFNKAG